MKRCFFFSRCASTVQYSTGLNARISCSRSTMSRSATVCTRPADSPFFTVFQRRGLALYPTSRSSTRRACCASTFFSSMEVAWRMAFCTASRVISWNITRRMGAPPRCLIASATCQAMASLAIGVRGEVDVRRDFGGALELRQRFFLAGHGDVRRLEAVGDVDAEALGGEIAHMTDRRANLVVRAQVLANGPGLGRGLHDDERLPRQAPHVQRLAVLPVAGGGGLSVAAADMRLDDRFHAERALAP